MSAKTLLVLDFDNTLTDTLSVWARGMRTALERISHHFNINMDPLYEATLREAILSAHGQHRFSDFGGLSHFLKQKGIPPLHEDPQTQYEIDNVRRLIRAEWFHHQRQDTVFYPNALQTLQHIRSLGTSQVIYTDTESPALIRRLWLMGCNAVKAGVLEKPGDVISLFDKFFAMPSHECDSHLLKRDVDPDFVRAMKDKMHVWEDRIRKPSPAHLHTILDMMETEPEQALMVGDNEKDAGCALPIGIDFGWSRYGAEINRETLTVLARYASPDFTYEFALIESKINRAAAGKPYLTLHQSLAEVLTHHEFAPAGCSYRRNHAPPELHGEGTRPASLQTPSLLPEPPAP